MSDLLFVYGTLRRGHPHPMADLLSAGADWLGIASICGRLYALDGYPGLVVDGAGGIVQGDLFRLRDPARLLPMLDDYEECSARFPTPHEYRRALSAVDTPAGRRDAWTYLYQGPVAGARLLVGGDHSR